MTSLDWLPEEDAHATQSVVRAVAQGAGEKLRGVALVGAWVPPVRASVATRVELLLLLSEAPMLVLGNLAHQVRQQPEAERLSLIVMTEREILRAADVFTLELADYAARHRVVWGSTPLGDLHFTPGELRLAIERRLRFLARDVRRTMLTGAWGDGRPVDEGAVLRSVVGDLLVAGHHLETLAGEEPPDGEDALLGALAGRAGVGSEHLLAHLRRLRAREPFARPVEALGELLVVIEGAVRVVDAMGVAPE